MKAIKTAVMIAALGLSGAGTAYAADAAPLPEEQSQGAVQYLSGGVGTDEAQAIQKLIPRYPLALQFVGNTGNRNEYLADVPVTIKDRQGQVVLDVNTDGPFLLVRLAPGKYEVSAERNGKLERRSVQVKPSGVQRLVFAWQAHDDA